MIDIRYFIVPGVYFKCYESRLRADLMTIRYELESSDHASAFISFWSHHYKLILRKIPDISNMVNYYYIMHDVEDDGSDYFKQIIQKLSNKTCSVKLDPNKLIEQYENKKFQSSAYMDWCLAILKYKDIYRIPNFSKKRSIPLYTSDLQAAKSLFEFHEYTEIPNNIIDICKKYLLIKHQENVFSKLST